MSGLQTPSPHLMEMASSIAEHSSWSWESCSAGSSSVPGEVVLRRPDGAGPLELSIPAGPLHGRSFVFACSCRAIELWSGDAGSSGGVIGKGGAGGAFGKPVMHPGAVL